MIIDFNDKRSTVTFGGGRFVCLFVKRGLIHKTLEIGVFELNENFQPVDSDSKHPLFIQNIPYDERTILRVMRIIGEIDSGEAAWIPNKYLSKPRNSEAVQKLEEQSVQMAFGFAEILLKQEKYEAAALHITATLLSEYLRSHPKYEARFLRKQSEAYTGLDNYFEAKKALISAMEKCEEDSDFRDYFGLGLMEYKLGNRKEAVDNLRRFIESVDALSATDASVRSENKDAIELSKQLIRKSGS